MRLKMVARVQIEKRKKRHGIKRLAQEAPNRHARSMSPLVAQNGLTQTICSLSASGAKQG
jgi:hypothetical protein